MLKLKKILKNISSVQIRGSKEVEITGICANSRLVAPGNLFIAKKGLTHDGSQFIDQAVAAGASAILTDIYDPSLKNITQIIHPDVASIEGVIAAQYYQMPSEQLFMVGLTGTNGKTTTSFLIKHMLDGLDGLCGLMGTIEYFTGTHHYQSTKTTPEVATNQKMLREMVLNHCKSAVMEVSSHALAQGRTEAIDYDVAVFTNLTLEHLDYHKTMDDYCEAKRSLFTSLNTTDSKKSFKKTAVVNADSSWHSKIVEGCKAKILTYGITNPAADLIATDVQLSSSETRFNVRYQEKTMAIVTPLIGRFNVYNVLATIGVGIAKGFSLENIARVLKSAAPIAGRLEQANNSLGLNVYVDFAHSDDALKNVLECLQEIKRGRIITVFGCGGDRDRFKRPEMARVSESLSDMTIVTSDNPRSEDPQAIIDEIVVGFRDKKNYLIESDRYLAIEQAIRLMKPDDILLIAGKGHETYQIFAHKTIEFDDRKVVLEICNKLLKLFPEMMNASNQ